MWDSLTGRFGSREVAAIERMDAQQLLQPLLNSDPLVSLRILAELSLHGEHERLRQLLALPEVNAHWQQFVSDPDTDEKDYAYALQFMPSVTAHGGNINFRN